jgi:hypothetical protein
MFAQKEKSEPNTKLRGWNVGINFGFLQNWGRLF